MFPYKIFSPGFDKMRAKFKLLWLYDRHNAGVFVSHIVRVVLVHKFLHMEGSSLLTNLCCAEPRRLDFALEILLGCIERHTKMHLLIFLDIMVVVISVVYDQFEKLEYDIAVRFYVYFREQFISWIWWKFWKKVT